MSLDVGGSFRSSSLFSSGSTKTNLAASTGVRTGVGNVKARKFGTEIGSLVIPEAVILLVLLTSIVLAVPSDAFCLRRASVLALRDFTIPVEGSTISMSTC